MHKTDEAEAPTVTDPAAAVAFEALRKEVALVRSAMAGLAAERSAIDIPDYSETLGEILRASAVSANAIKAIGKLPALQQTPRTMAQEIVAAGESARRADQQELLLAREAFEGALREITTSLRSARSEARQRRWLIWTGVGGIFVGMLLWAVGAGMIARAAPESWYWPERMAAHTLRMDREAAGIRLITTAAPAHWNDIVRGYRIVQANRDAITGCEDMASTGAGAVFCVIKIRKRH